MKRLITIAAVLALSVPSVFAAKTNSVTFSEAVTAGSTQIAPGDYKVSYEGSGPDVKVTLTKSHTAPIVLNAKLLADQKGSGEVSVGTANGAHVLQQIALPGGTLDFGAGDQK
jgi:hypothetical protein